MLASVRRFLLSVCVWTASNGSLLRRVQRPLVLLLLLPSAAVNSFGVFQQSPSSLTLLPAGMQVATCRSLAFCHCGFVSWTRASVAIRGRNTRVPSSRSLHLLLNQQVHFSGAATTTSKTAAACTSVRLASSSSTTNHLTPSSSSTVSSPSSSIMNGFTQPTLDNDSRGENGKAGGDKGYSAYEWWVRRLYETNMFHPVKMGLHNIEQIHAAQGNPMDQTVIVHVAGTNGKGSVCLKIANTLQHLPGRNLKVGLFCSPHVSSFRERMQINGQLISEDEVVQLLPPIYDICRQQNIPATFFEITTALAFAFFAAHQVDVVVLETGLGGRLDATNVIKSPALSIITSIGLEHTRILGDTIELIALEKGGIIKPSRPVLVGPSVPHAVLRQCALEKGASGYFTCEDILGLDTLQPPSLDHDNGDDELLDYDLENSRIATAALKLLQQSHAPLVGNDIQDDVIAQGTSIRPPCRFEHVPYKDTDLTVILDVAHNPPAMKYLIQKLRKQYTNRTIRMVVGMSADKDLRECGTMILQAVNNDASRIHWVEAAHPRAAKLPDILEATGLHDANYNLQDPSVTTQIQLAVERALAADEILIVCGSVFLMSETREALGIDEPRDSPYIAAMAGAGVRYAQENFPEPSSSK